jgi:hypothetical protein
MNPKRSYTKWFHTTWGLITYAFISILFIVLICAVAYLVNTEVAIALVFSSLGAFFVIIKHEVDVYNYNLQLFETRFKMLTEIGDLLDSAHRNSDNNSVLTDVIRKLTPLIHKAHFIFDEESNKLIRELLKHLLHLQKINNKDKRTEEEVQIKADIETILDHFRTSKNLYLEFPELYISL